MNEQYEWQEESACSRPENRHAVEFFFSTKKEEQLEAKKICGGCPVRRDCAKYALETRQIWGIWGGNDEIENRRTLSVDIDGVESRRGRYPRCPYCKSNTAHLSTAVVPRPGGGRWTSMKIVKCEVCEFVWASRTSANAVEAYHAAKKETKSRTLRERQARATARGRKTD